MNILLLQLLFVALLILAVLRLAIKPQATQNDWSG